MQVIQPAPEAGTAFELSPGLQSSLEPIGFEVKKPCQEILFRQGTASKGVYLLRSGTARIFMVDDHGKMVNCRDVDRGSILGLPATLCVEPYMFTAETKTDCTFVFIPTDRFQQFLRSHPALCMEVVQLMSRELATVNRKRIEPSRCSHPDCSLRGTCSHLAP